ncbi:MAG: GntR family transcriptional regulator [Actinobacteria bacterium]|nr:GntR family transcriptional regulator [Actinomycetota bacterium]
MTRPPSIDHLVEKPTRSVRQQVADALREAIVSGVLPPGERLRQEQLCTLFGVSPGPLREAFRQLESEGLIEHFSNRGSFVLDISEEELNQVLIPVRLVLEKEAFKRTAQQLSEEDVFRLDRYITDMETGAATGSIGLINEADHRFHEYVVAASGLRHTLQLWRSVSPRLRVQFARLAPRHERLSEIVDEHRVLLEALRSGKPDAIDSALELHISQSARDLLNRQSGPRIDATGGAK